MRPEIDLLGLPLKTFGLCFALGFVAAGAIIQRRLAELGRPVEYAYEIVFAALGGGLVGSRLYYVITHTGELADNPLRTLFGGSGLVWYGGALGGALAILVWAKWRGMLDRRLLDMCAIPLASGYAIGRIGCQLSGDGDYGKPWNGPFAMSYPNGTVPTDVPVHPTPLYEALTMLTVAWLLWRFRDTFRPGVIFAFYLCAAGLERFLVEFIRRNPDELEGLTSAQLTSIGLVIVGLVWLAVAARRPGGLRGDAGRGPRPTGFRREPSRAEANPAGVEDPARGNTTLMPELKLTEDPDDKRRWTLDGVGELHWEKGFFKNGGATLTTGGATWTLENSTFSSKAKALDATGNEAATYEPKGAFSRGGEIIAGGRTFALKPAARFKNRYALAEGETELATIETEGWAQRRVTVELDDDSAPAEVLLMACWRVRGFADESAAASASSAGAV